MTLYMHFRSVKEVMNKWQRFRFKENLKSKCSPIAQQFVVSVFLTNIYTVYHGNQISEKYEVDLPSLSQYMANFNF